MLRIVLISFAFLAIKLESASFPDYAPFAQNEKPKRYRVVELAHWPTSEHKIEFGITVNSVRLLEVLQEENGTSLAMFKGSVCPWLDLSGSHDVCLSYRLRERISLI